MIEFTPAASPSAPTLQSCVDRWLAGLAGRNAATGAAPVIDHLSPLKKHKGRPPEFGQGPGRRWLLRLLAERAAGFIFNRPPVGLVERLAGPALTASELELSREIAAEVAGLSPDLLKGWTLAGLQLWPPGADALKKRNGSYYTGPDLAAYIAGRTLLSPDATVIDPACGGGAFLLAALDRLAELNPACPPAGLLTGRLYGLDLDPGAVTLARLALLLRARELAGRPLDQRLGLVVAAQVRVGNALVGRAESRKSNVESRMSKVEGQPDNGWRPAYRQLRESYAANRAAFYRAAAEPAGFEQAHSLFVKLEAGLDRLNETLAAEIAALPLFNGPQDGLRLAALRPFDWPAAFPEVFQAGGFTAALGNPPYLGFNDYSGIEKAYFAHYYRPVYNLKSDLLYYFIFRSFQLLRADGRAGLVTSRFWKEAAFAVKLRGWLAGTTSLEQIEDFGGEQWFEDAAVDVCLLFARNQAPPAGHRFCFNFEGRRESFSQAELPAAPWTWLRRLPAEQMLLAKIQEQSRPLGQVAECRTGVQTGLDRVFFVDNQSAGRIEPAALRRAIKNSDIRPGEIAWRGRWLIYPPDVLEPVDFPGLLAYLAVHRPALERRRRYGQPFPYYRLQWPREPGLFARPAKLVTPYKAARNTFAVDRQSYFFSTDVISVVFPPEWQIEDLAANFLNSRLSTFQFRAGGKPVSGGQWDYYANPVKRLAFPLAAISPDTLPHDEITRLGRAGLAQAELDELVNDLYGLNQAEQALVGKIAW